MSKEHEGGCQCGAVRFKTTGKPVRAMACHCTGCKLRTGAPYGIGVYFNEEQVVLEGPDRIVYEFNSDETGRWIKNEICSNCGSVVTWTLEMRPGLRAIAGGSFDDPGWYDVEAHIWTRSARPDMVFPDGMKVCEEALV